MGGALRFAAADARRGDANHAFGYVHDHLAPGQIDVERRSQRADLALAGLHDERTGRIVRDFEQRLPPHQANIAPALAVSDLDRAIARHLDGRPVGPSGRTVSDEPTIELQLLMPTPYAGI